MSVIIRLQNLPWSANALDIRAFFRGLSIPDGGVHIVGGEMGDAFIAFSTDEDARQAMMLDRGKVNEVQIRLLLSSRAEMQKVIEAARKHSLAMMQMQQQQQKQSSQMQQLQHSSTSQQELTAFSKQSNTESPFITAQPPVITSTSLKNILSQSNTTQRIPGLSDSTNSNSRLNQSYTAGNINSLQHNTFLINDNSLESSKSSRDRFSLEKDDNNKGNSTRSKERDRFKDLSRSRSKSRSRSRSRSRDRDRRRSRSRDRGSRRRRDSRSHSRDRDRDRKRDRYGRRSRSRSRERYRNRYDRGRGNDRNDTRRNSWEKDKRNDPKEFEKDKKDLSEVPMVIDDDNAKSSSPPSIDTQNKNFNIWNVPPPTQINSASAFMQLPFNQQQQQQQQQSQAQNQIPLYQLNPYAAAAAMQAQFPQQFQAAMQPKEGDAKKSTASGSQSNADLSNSANMLNFQNFFHAQSNYPYPTSSTSNFNQLSVNSQQLAFQNPYVASTSTDSTSKEKVVTTTASNIQKKDHSNKLPNFSGMFSNSSYNKDIKMENNDSTPSSYNIKSKNMDDSNKYYPSPSLSSINQQQQKSFTAKDNSLKSSDKNYPKKDVEIKRDTNINSVTEENYEELTGRCVKISNMCPSTTYSDLRRFFSGLYIANNGIKMINDKHGLRIGTAYVRFIREESKPKALARSGQLLKSKKVFIDTVTEDEFDEEIDSFKPQRQNRSNQRSSEKNRSGPGGGNSDEDDNDNNENRPRAEEKPFSSIILEDLPAFAKEQDIMKMFSAYSLLDIILGNRLTKTGRNENVCYVKFAREEDAKDALREKHKHMIGYKQISVKSLDDEEFNEAKEKHNDEIEGVHRKKYREEDEKEHEDNIKEEKHQRNKHSEDNKSNEMMKEKINKTDKDEERNEEKNKVNKMSNRGDKDENLGAGQSKRHQSNYDPFKNREDALNEDNKSQDGTRSTLDIRDPRLDNSRSSSHSNDIPSLLSLPHIATESRQNNRQSNNRKPSRFNQPHNNNDNINPNQDKTIYILMRNCDYKATKQDIANLFLPIGIDPNRVEILYNNRNQPSGEIIVEFLTPEDAERSLTKSNTQCLSRNVRIELIPPRFVANRLGEDFLTQFNCPLTFGENAGGQDNLMGGSPANVNPGNNRFSNNLNYNNTANSTNNMNDNSNNSMNFNNSVEFEANLLRLLIDSQLTSGNLNIGDGNNANNNNNNGFNNPALQDVINRFRMGSSNNGSGNNMNTMMRNNNHNNNSNNNAGDNRNARRGNRPSRFSDKNENGSQNYGNSSNNISNNRYNNQNISTTCGVGGGNNNNTSALGNSNMLNGPINHANVDQFGQPGCVVEMENVPYKAGIEDILNFFSKYNIAPCNVIRRYNDDGTPTGDARVAFSSPMEARSAIEAKRHHKIFNRTIYLSLLGRKFLRNMI